jgi:hypothetical protein
MTTKGHPLIGKWRITSMELWDAAFIDLLGPGYIRFDADGGGEFVFGAVQGGLDCHFGIDSMPHARPDACGADTRRHGDNAAGGAERVARVDSAEMQIIS